MADRFYANCDLTPGMVTLQGSEAHHLTTVCRLRPGDPVCLFNGDGHDYLGRVEQVGKRAVTVEVQQIVVRQRELPFRLQVASALPKGDRAPFLIEKLTELGVTDFIPLATVRSVVHPRETKLEKLERQVIEACKQCGRNVLLRVHPLADWATFCTASFWPGRTESAPGPGAILPGRKLLAHPSSPKSIPALSRDSHSPGGSEIETGVSSEGGTEGSRLPVAGMDILVAIGPEGGFTDEEVDRACSAGWERVSLGPRILRIETAALALAVLCALGRV